MKTINLFMAYSSLWPQLAKWLAVVATLVLAGLWSVDESQAAILSWSGGGGANANWNNNANWGFAGTPASGDTLIFPASQPNLVNTNNIAGLTLNQIRFVGAGGGYDIRGNAFTLTNNIEATNSAVANTLENNITLAGADQTVEVTTILTLSGALSGSVGLTKTGAGTLLFQTGGNNTYAGTTRVNAGTLQLNVGGTNAFGGPLVIGDGSGAGSPVVRLLQSSEIPDNQPITVNLNGLLDLNSFFDVTGPLTLQGATVSTGSGLLSLNGDLTVLGSAVIPIINGNLRFNGGMRVVSIAHGTSPYDLNLFANVSDAGGGLLFTNSVPSLTFAQLLGNNTFTGPLIIDNITLAAETPTALGAGGSLASTTVGSHGTLWLYSTGVTNGSLTMADGATLVGQNNTTWAGPIVLNGDVTLDCYPSGNTLDLVGTISGSGGFNKVNAGTVRLSGTNANTYAGTTLVSFGTLELNKIGGGTTVYAVPGSLVLSNGTTARLLQPFQLYSAYRSLALTVTLYPDSVLDLNGFSDWLAQLSISGAQITAGSLLYLSGNVTIVSATNSNSLIRGNLQLFPWGGVTNNILTNSGHYFSPDLIISANVSSFGNNTLIKDGDGEVELRGTNNTFTGATIVNNGDLWVDYTNGLGNTNLPATVNNTGSLFLNFNAAIGLKPLILNGNGSSIGALSAGGTNSWDGNIILATNVMINCFSNTSMTLNGAISGPGSLTENGAGLLTLAGSTANTYAGLTTLKPGTTLLLSKSILNGAIPGSLDVFGTLRLGANNQIADSADVHLESGSLFDFGTYFDRIDTLRGSGNVTFGVNGFIEVGLNNGSSTYDGVMSGTGYPGYTVGKIGSGTFTMNGNNTFTVGVFQVSSPGKLIVNGSQPQIPVIVGSSATLGGSGTVGPIAASGIISPGNSPGILTSSNVTFSASGNFTVELTGPNPGVGGYDQLNVRGTNDLANASLTVLPLFTSPVAVGQTFTILNNNGVDPITGTFSGLPEGAGIRTNGFSFSISYVGGTGNDVVLTLTNAPLAQAGSSVSLGNGNGTIDPNECNYLNVVITNQTPGPITGISATLLSTTPNVAVTHPFSPYADVPGSGQGTNTVPFQISTTTNFVCGTTINLQLTVASSSHGSFTIPVVVTSGAPSLTPVRFDNNTVTNVPDVGTIESTNIVGSWSGGPLTRIAVSLWLGAPLDSDLSLTLIAPDGASVNLSSGNGAGQNFGTGGADGSRTTFDDAAATSITAGTSPFVGSFRPQAPLAGLIGPPVGAWRLRIQDTGFFGSPDTLRAWSLFLYGTACPPGGGLCELCPNVTISGALGPTSPTQTGYVNFNGIPSTCGVAKACPGTFGAGPYPSDNYVFRNGPTNACVTVTVENDSPTVQMLATVYSGSYNLTNADKCVNYLADGGFIIQFSNPTQAFSFNVAPNATFVVNLIASAPAPVCPYKLTVSGGDCRPVLNITPAGAQNVQLDWTTAAAGFRLERTNHLVSGVTNWAPVTNIPIVVNSRFLVTNSAAISNQFYRLHKP
ncbi:MAG TPA: autotransporter-associated beta strand repeat-containing protein [Candidatus Binatia bacterium]|jgi:autotransporter-associated beta strand protein|nr:autotransporter-associated beta strand repeat-containing protein [Candidatus Binatia bacterium]